MTMQTTTTNKWQARIEQRRGSGEVVAYVDGLIRINHVPIEDVAPFLAADELRAVQDAIEERARKQAEARAELEASELRRKDAQRELAQRLAVFRQANPFPVPPVTLAEARDAENDEKAFFDILRRYHVTEVFVTCTPWYHYDEFNGFENFNIESFTLGGDIQVQYLGDAFFVDEDDVDNDVFNALEQAIENVVGKKAYAMTREGKIVDDDDPICITFNVPKRTITVDADVLVVDSRRLSFSVK